MARYKAADLDIERNGEPFEYEMEDGTVFTFTDPKGIDPAKVVRFEEIPPMEQAELTIQDGRFKEFVEHPEVVDMYYYEAVMAAYTKHFGLGTAGEGRASKRSSKSSAKR